MNRSRHFAPIGRRFGGGQARAVAMAGQTLSASVDAQPPSRREMRGHPHHLT
jgi:hypothetical protein